MTKTCIICGAAFQSPPSSKKVTCSPACRSARAAAAARRGHKWSSDARAARASDPAVQAQMTQIQHAAVAAAMEIPEGQRGPQHRSSKIWHLISPDGQSVTVANLLHWAREHYDLFEPDSRDIDASAVRIAKGIQAIATSQRGAKSRQRPVTSYKGWRLAALPEEKE